jgi:hypothetical protein
MLTVSMILLFRDVPEAQVVLSPGVSYSGCAVPLCADAFAPESRPTHGDPSTLAPLASRGGAKGAGQEDDGQPRGGGRDLGQGVRR